jgi:beta-lactam-binding protein with PASTA domain/predicted Ser/Thr protein kinase
VTGIARDTLIDGRYRVVNRIGSGGMADVWCADDTQLGRKVALKLLHPRFAEDDEFVERFRREASSAAGLQHPNVVGVFDRGEWDGTYYIAMEYLPGRTLKQLVRDHGALDPALAVSLVVQILKAARFAHRRGIVHRDIKPHNVIVDEEGRAKVTDFGIARAGASDMTETGSIMGTAQYLSPEQAQGHPVDSRADLYSIGVVLYELLTGHVPFDGESPVTIALKHVSEDPVPPGQMNPEVSPELDAVVMRAMAKDPNQRFQDADSFVAALQHAMAGEHPTGAPLLPDPVAELRAADRRTWRSVVVTALIVLALAALGVGAWLLLRPEQRVVPDVVGRLGDVAAQTLQDEGFEVRILTVQSATVARDRVVTQDPGAGSEAKEGSTVAISVSGGPGEATVPDVVGLSGSDAAAKLRDAGFRVRTRREFSDDVDAGDVIELSPPEGSVVERGTRVTLVVSRGQQRVAVPNLVGSSRASAERALAAVGLLPRVTERETTESDPDVVLEQSPAADTQVAKESTVAFVVATAPPQVEVPDVTTSPVPGDEARASLAEVGLDVVVRDEPVTDPTQDGIVVAQDPTPGETVPEGSRVVIRVGRLVEEPAPTATPTPSPTPVPTPEVTQP